MQKSTKIKIILVISLGVFLLGAFFYFQKYGENGKFELDLTQNSEEQKIAKENVNNQAETLDIPEKTENASDESAKNSPSIEVKNDQVVEDNPEVSKDVEKPRVTKLSITNRLVSFGFQKATDRKIDTIIIHSSYDAIGNEPYSVSGVIAEYKSYGVSPHYIVDRKGSVIRLVEDKNIAYHAGESEMPDGRTGVNAFSIGIEMLTTKKDKLTQEQYDALKLLISDLKGKCKITSVLGHNQIAPGRKDDPWNFEWNKLK